ncbi:ABC transporter substrate-binding protein [Pectinatus haikarae]|uniref:ABC transporter substrate-binding protein n=1 Tax=Pectinatus haikarae TaxID=349096 RepID=UPI0018C6B279|nr:ABC transporter substrate-binding protein [Pectinatus haikarae]
MNPYFSLSDKVYDVTERYPELIDWLAENGFENLRNDVMRKTIGRTISLETAFRSKELSPELLEKQMVEIIQKKCQKDDSASVIQHTDSDVINVAGVLPCPIRVQLLEKLDNWLENQKDDIKYELPAASMGIEWLRESIEKSKTDELADIYLSAGFSLFFDKHIMGRHMDAGIFSDLTGEKKLNAHFDNNEIDLKDPLKRYSIIGAVPAVFMVNTELLGERAFPKSWSDLLKPEFADTIALPMQDLDLFNAVLLNIYNNFGEAGISSLGKNLYAGMHPSEMVKSAKRKKSEQSPLITIMPYFFTCMIDEKGPIKAVWPEEGAIISPIFLLTKTSSQKKIQPLVDFLFSKELGELFCLDGKFPSTHPQVNNGLSPEQKFIWPGWDFIHSHDIGKILAKSRLIFSKASGGII